MQIFLKFAVLFALITPSLFAEEVLTETSTEHPPEIIKFRFLPPRNRLFAPLLSDLRESRFSVHFVNSFQTPGDGPLRVWGSMGTVIPLLETEVFQEEKNLYTIQTAVEANSLILMRLRPKGGFSMDSFDGKLGAVFAFRSGNLSSKLGFSHWSGHLGDNYINQFSFPKRGFSREFVTWILSYDFPFIRPYGGVHYIFTHRHPLAYKGRDFFNAQWGAEVIIPKIFGKRAIFVAGDFQSEKEHRFYIGQSYKIGLLWRGETLDPMRISALFFSGFDPRGEFYDKKITLWGLGIDFHP